MKHFKIKNQVIIIIFGILFLSCSNKGITQNKNFIKNELKKFSQDPDLKNASIGFSLIDLATQKEVISLNPDLTIAPASVQKIITTSTALELLGEKYRFQTTIEYDGYIDTLTKTLHGNLYISGGGDPCLGSEHYEEYYYKPYFMEVWLKAIKEKRIQNIEGYIIGDAQIYSTEIVPESWTWGNMGNYFGAGACGLSIFDNTYRIYFKTPAKVGAKSTIQKIEPSVPDVFFDNQVVSSNRGGDNTNIYGSPYNNQRQVRGTLPKSRINFTVKGSVPDPAYLAANEFFNYLKDNKIKIKKTATTVRKLQNNSILFKGKRKAICINYSPKLSKIVHRTNIRSVNLYAEHLLNHIGLTELGHGETNKGVRAIKNFWTNKGMDTDGFFMKDGSGLSRYNAVTAHQLTFIFNYMKHKGRYFKAFYNSLPVAGKTGTLKYLGKGTNAEGRVHAKSGSINKVRAYAGYVNSSTGKKYAFAIMVNNYNCSGYKMKELLENLIVAISKT